MGPHQGLGPRTWVDAEEVESLIDVIENLNKSWEEKLEMKGKPKQRKWKGMNHVSDAEDNEPCESEVVHSASILSQPRRVGKRPIKLTTRAMNVDQDAE